MSSRFIEIGDSLIDLDHVIGFRPEKISSRVGQDIKEDYIIRIFFENYCTDIFLLTTFKSSSYGAKYDESDLVEIRSYRLIIELLRKVLKGTLDSENFDKEYKDKVEEIYSKSL